MLSDELLRHLAQNRSEPVYDQQQDEVLKRILLDVMAGADRDESDPDRADPNKYYTEARKTAAAGPEVKDRTELRKILYSRSLPFTLGSIMRLGPPFSQSRFFNLMFLKTLQKIHAGVSVSSHHQPSPVLTYLRSSFANYSKTLCAIWIFSPPRSNGRLRTGK